MLGTVVVLMAMGTRATFGLFIQPMGLEHGWGREIFSMAFALQNLTWGFGAIGAVSSSYGKMILFICLVVVMIILSLGINWKKKKSTANI